MAKIIGKLREKKRRELVRQFTTRLSHNFRLEAEFEEGYGPHLLAERLRSMDLPDNVTVILQPALGFIGADACVIGPGKVLVLQALHWAGPIRPDEGPKGEWTGAGHGVYLGRPDRRAHLFADRLEYSELTKGFEVLPAVVFTAGPVQFDADSLVTLIQWDELEDFLRKSLGPGLDGFSAERLVKAITPP